MALLALHNLVQTFEPGITQQPNNVNNMAIIAIFFVFCTLEAVFLQRSEHRSPSVEDKYKKLVKVKEMSHKRRLTGYQEDTEELIKSRRSQWEQRAKRPQTYRKKGREKTPSRRSRSKTKSPLRQDSPSRHDSPRVQETQRRQGPPSRLEPPHRVESPSKSPRKYGSSLLPESGPQRPPQIGGEELEGVVSTVMTSQIVCGEVRRKRRPILKNCGDGSATSVSHGRLSGGESEAKQREHVKFTSKVLMEERRKEEMECGDRDPPPPCGLDLRGMQTHKSGYLVRPRSPRGSSAGSRLGDANIVFEDPWSSLHASMDKVCPGEVRPSCAPRNTTPNERKLFELCRKGNVSCVQRFLTSRPKVNVNAKSFEGETALRIAVKYGHEPLTAFLASLKGICLGDILMYAIRFKQYPIVKMFCETYDLDMVCCPNYDFPAWVTPLSLAAEVGCYEIIDYLLNIRDHDPIPEPHPVKCRCKVLCMARKKGDQLEIAQRALHIYSAISQPSYFIHITTDPFTRCFTLYRRILETAEFFIVLKPNFVKLAERTQQFAVDLIAECRDSNEVRIVLTHDIVKDKKFWERLMTCPNELPMLFMAMDYKQKCFVAQPNVQVFLKELWIGNFYAWRVMSTFKKSQPLMSRLVIMPYIYYLLLVRPKSENAHHYALPVNKMLSSMACYLFFLAFVFHANIKTRPKVRTAYTHKDPEVYITLFVFAYTFNMIRQAIAIHPRRFIRNGWNLYDMSTFTAFWLAIAFWISAQIHYLLMDCPSRAIERKYWNGIDPVLMADGFFVLGSVLAYLKLLYYFQVDWNFGPMKIAMDSMVKEFVKYSVFWLLILFSFTVALGKFYAYYDGMKYVDPDTGNTLKQEDAFVSYKSTFKTLFWGIFGLSSYTTADVVIENIRTANGTFLNEHDFTEFIGYFAFGSYTIMMGIIVMNMVIATMGGAFVRVLADVDTEWKYSNAHIYLYYTCQSVLAPPFNLIPHSYMLQGLLHGRKRHICEPPPKALISYEELCARLILRYYRTKAEVRRKQPICFIHRFGKNEQVV